MIKVGLNGASGRVGALVISEILQSDGFELSCVYVRHNLSLTYDMPSSVLVTTDKEELCKASDVVIDFSVSESTYHLLIANKHIKTPLVIGTTSLSKECMGIINTSSKDTPILYATNMSQGMVIVNYLAKLVAKTLPDADVEIVERHHRHKRDAPSGTALTLASIVAKERGVELEEVLVSDREHAFAPRKEGAIGISSVRGGDLVGEHAIEFLLDGEAIELKHTATDRTVFAKSALKGANFVIDAKPGLYSMEDVLGLKL